MTSAVRVCDYVAGKSSVWTLNSQMLIHCEFQFPMKLAYEAFPNIDDCVVNSSLNMYPGYQGIFVCLYNWHMYMHTLQFIV